MVNRDMYEDYKCGVCGKSHELCNCCDDDYADKFETRPMKKGIIDKSLLYFLKEGRI